MRYSRERARIPCFGILAKRSNLTRETVNRFSAFLDVSVGSLDEDDDQQGIAHYLEHLVFLGTEKWRTADEMKELMGTLGMSFGGDTNASTDHSSTIYTMDSPAGDDKVAWPVIAIPGFLCWPGWTPCFAASQG